MTQTKDDRAADRDEPDLSRGPSDRIVAATLITTGATDQAHHEATTKGQVAAEPGPGGGPLIAKVRDIAVHRDEGPPAIADSPAYCAPDKDQQADIPRIAVLEGRPTSTQGRARITR